MTVVDPAVISRLNSHARQLARVERMARRRTPQLPHSSLENGAVEEYDAQGQLVARYGKQWDGTHTSVSLAGPVPPTPGAPEAYPIPTGFAIRWGGDWSPAVDGATGLPIVAPSDFGRVEVHVDTTPSRGILFSTYRQTIESPRGGEVLVQGLAPDADHYVWLVVRSESGKFSEASAAFGPIQPGKLAAGDLDIDLAAIGGNRIHRDDVEPVGPHRLGDLWLKMPENIAYRWEGDPADWVESRDTGVAEALQTAFDADQAAQQAAADAAAASTAAGGAVSAADAAQLTADGRAQLFVQDAEPGALAADAKGVWVDTNAENTIHDWSGSAWVARRFGNSAIEPGSLVASDVIATGTVSAALLEAVMVLANVILTADPSGPHVRIDSQGLRSYALNPFGALVQTSQFGGTGADRVLITDPVTGASLGGIDEQANIRGKSIAVDDFSLRGDSLEWMFFLRPIGLVGYGGVYTSPPSTTSSRGAFDIEFKANPGRLYRIHTSTLNLNPSTVSTYGWASLIARPSAEGPPSLTAGKTLARGNGSVNIAGAIEPFVLQRVVRFEELFANNTPPNGNVSTNVRLLLAYGVTSGGGSMSIFSGGDQYPIHVYVEDVGPSVIPFASVPNDGSGSTVPPVRQYTTTWADTWGANWKSNSSALRTGFSELIQGYSPDVPADGVGLGQAGFAGGIRSDGTGVGNFQAELAGATIQSIRLFVYTTYWGLSAGGTIQLGTHRDANVPATKPTTWTLNRVASAAHPNPGSKWIDLTAQGWAATGLKDGTIKGFTFGDGLSTSLQHLARIVSDPSDSRRLVLEVVYSK